ncbi:MAG: XRE family transcriptional regulator [Proteobacteria bacterium]|nr:XRE family transcriptional regulator [Pseudomonadota bacterium]
MTTVRFGSVWDAIEDSAAVAASFKLRAQLASAILDEVARRKLTQQRAAVLMGVTQPRVSDLVRGRLDLFSLDTLVDLAARLGLEARVALTRRRAA